MLQLPVGNVASVHTSFHKPKRTFSSSKEFSKSFQANKAFSENSYFLT